MFTRCNASSFSLKRWNYQIIARSSIRKHTRKFASSSQPTLSNAPTNASSSGALSIFGSLTTDLDQIAPRFEVDAEQVQILKEPREFYETLKSKISLAQHRIYLSTLYIGKTEHELISTIRAALHKTPTLRVSFLTDALRGTREEPENSCASLLTPLVAEFGPERVEVRMFHTPNLVGFRKKILPKRINEGWGLQHMKLYGIDDEIILSGANLSNDYFTNRQDRYHVFKSKPLTDYYHRIHSAVSSISFLIMPSSEPSGFTMTWPTSNPCSSPLESSTAYIAYAQTLLTPLIQSSNPALAASTKTLIYPLFQLTPLLPPTSIAASPSTELPALTLLLTYLSQPPFTPTRWTFTAGYFNMTPSIRALLLRSLAASTAHGTVITAHPHANGFFGSRGVSGMLPAAYTLLARRFLDAVKEEGLQEKVTLKEWRRGEGPGGWTYHAKGLWVTLGGESAGPSVTLVGSSNYTARSHTLDLEANALIVTRDEDLRKRLGEEEKWLQEHAQVVGPDEFSRTERRVSWRVRVALWIVGIVGGAL